MSLFVVFALLCPSGRERWRLRPSFPWKSRKSQKSPKRKLSRWLSGVSHMTRAHAKATRRTPEGKKLVFVGILFATGTCSQLGSALYAITSVREASSWYGNVTVMQQQQHGTSACLYLGLFLTISAFSWWTTCWLTAELCSGRREPFPVLAGPDLSSLTSRLMETFGILMTGIHEFLKYVVWWVLFIYIINIVDIKKKKCDLNGVDAVIPALWGHRHCAIVQAIIAHKWETWHRHCLWKGRSVAVDLAHWFA